MTVQQHGLILLIKSALTGQAYVLPKDFDLTDAFKTAANHVITTLVYYGAYNCGVDTNSALMCDNLQRVYTSIMVGERQDAEIKRVIEAFDNHAIEHMALKGVHLKKMYPKPEMRKMGDADILIQYSEYEKIRNVMLELGFTEGIESDHEFCWTKGPVLIELHKRLIPSYNKDYYAYFGDGWKLAKIRNDSGFGYTMTDEDQMIYLFTHFAKHYRDSGIGIRHMVDLWVYRRNHPSLDEDYIRAELEKLHLLEFYTNIIKALSVWFEDAPCDERSDFITQVIFTSGEYGTKDTSAKSAVLKETKSCKSVFGVKCARLFRTVFVPYESMSDQYPLLKKLPFLLPFMWIIHLVRRLFDRQKCKKFVETRLSAKEAEIAEYSDSLHYVGLDFNFK